MINKDILSGAPDGATHWDYEGYYVRYNSNSYCWEFCKIDTGAWVPTRAIEAPIRSLADIKRIEELEYKLKRVSDILLIVKLNPLHDRAMQVRRVNAAYEALGGDNE